MRKSRFYVRCHEDGCTENALTVVVKFHGPYVASDPLWAVGKPPSPLPRPAYCGKHIFSKEPP